MKKPKVFSARYSQGSLDMNLFLDPHFNQDDMGGRYASTRDRKVKEKSRIARSRRERTELRQG